jgi:hypothetical protein
MMNNETFIVNIKCRENATWQGKVTWAQKSKTKYFRSTLELIKMLNGAMDDDNAADTVNEQEEQHPEITIDDVINNTEKEIKVITKIEHLLTPEVRKYIMDKFLNDKRREWMLKREESVK